MHIALFAHAFGQRYDLPVPLWLYIYGGAAAVLLSFVVVGYFVDKKRSTVRPPVFICMVPHWVRVALGVFGCALLGLIVLAGLVGGQVPMQNITITFFWITFLLGCTYLTVLLGNWWPYIRPTSVLVRLAERLAGVRLGPFVRYPERLGYYPALVTYIGLIWLELLSTGFGVVPQNLAWVLVGYSVVSATGAIVFGARDWYRYGDFFSVFFRLIGAMAPFVRKDGNLYVRRPLTGLLTATHLRFSLLLFVLFMLSSTAFDGLRDTKVFNRLLAVMPQLSGLDFWLLLLLPCVFLALYMACMGVMYKLVQSGRTVRELAVVFSVTIVPIAFAYNVAHYWTLLVIQGQQLIALVSDPLGWGWNVFGTAGYTVNVGIVGASTVWYTQVGLIVLGHIAAVYLAHRVALRLYPDTKQAVRSQYPMLALMLLYTMISLWIIAQPITA